MLKITSFHSLAFLLSLLLLPIIIIGIFIITALNIIKIILNMIIYINYFTVRGIIINITLIIIKTNTIIIINKMDLL